MNKNSISRTTFILALGLSFSACTNTLDRLDNIGQPPVMAKIENPVEKPEYKPLSWPLPAPRVIERQYSNSLWQPGAKAFFRDQRAAQVGDILTVNITIADEAKIENETERSRSTTEKVAAPKVFGLEGKLGNLTPGIVDPASLFNISGTTTNTGDGEIERKEDIKTQVAALITQVLPNGNLVISGRQEVRVNFEVREVAVDGVVRPEDISSNNSIELNQIAEARVSYGGRGQITDVQQPRWGTQAIDILSPF
jgi:flagellar L-ring protein precursor FlgH